MDWLRAAAAWCFQAALLSLAGFGVLYAICLAIAIGGVLWTCVLVCLVFGIFVRMLLSWINT